MELTVETAAMTSRLMILLSPQQRDTRLHGFRLAPSSPRMTYPKNLTDFDWLGLLPSDHRGSGSKLLRQRWVTQSLPNRPGLPVDRSLPVGTPSSPDLDGKSKNVLLSHDMHHVAAWKSLA